MTEINKTTKDFSPAERAALFEQFKGSGLAYDEFAREHNMNPATLKNWIWLEAIPADKKRSYSPTEKKKIIEAFLSSGMTKQIFCKQWGVCQKSLGIWVKRYEAEGSEGLMRRTRGADDKRVGMKVPVAVQSEIISLKRKEPSFGLKKMKHWLYRFKGVKVSAGSIRKTVKAEGFPLVKKTKKKKKSSDRVRRFERAKPMQLWQSDITQMTLAHHWMRVYLTVFMDDHSRYIVGWRLQSRQTAELVIDSFKDAVTRFGKPEEVLTDQGRQYFAWRGKSELEKLLEKEGIKHVVSRAHHPQTLGKCERFWETVSNEFWTRAKPQDLEEARVRLKYFIDHYNHQRPHQGLDGQVPADRFFGIAQEVREVIEKTVEQNALNMALGELPRAPAFLIGQVGDQRIAFHGTSGSFYLTHENLGEENGKSDGKSTSEGSVAREASGVSNPDGAGEKVSEAAASALGEIEFRDENSKGNSHEGFMGSGNDGGARVCVQEGANGDGVLDGEAVKGGSGEAFRSEDDQILANGSASDSGDDGGITESASI